MRNKNAPVVDPSFGGECVALTENGCKLSHDERPKGGRVLIPDLDIQEDGFKINCHSDWSKKESAIEWYTYRDILIKLMKEYFDQSKDENLVLLAKRYNTTADELKRINNLSSNMLSIGQVLLLPSNNGNDETTNYITYYVQRGDNLYNLAREYNTTVSEIKKLNNLTSDLLSIGQSLLLPA